MAGLDPSGGTLWDRQVRHDAPPTRRTLHVDPNGNVSVIGISIDPPGAARPTNRAYVQAHVRRYDGRGEEVWSIEIFDVRTDSRGGTDSAGNVYVLFDQSVRKYDSAGNHLLTVVETDRQVSWQAIGVAPQGDVHVLGSVLGDDSSQRRHLWKYGVDGEMQWEREIESSDRLENLAVDDNGLVYAVGHGGGSTGSVAHRLIVAYDSSGDERWRAEFSNWSKYATTAQIAIDRDSNVYVAFPTSTRSRSWLVYRFDSAGKRAWSRELAPPKGPLPQPRR